MEKTDFLYYIGIDISKNTLDFAVVAGKEMLLHRVCKNQKKAIKDFLDILSELSGFTFKNCIFCMENTGFYCNILLDVLMKYDAYVVLENPIQIKRSIGIIREKTDKADAFNIAFYAQRNIGDLRRWNPRRDAISALNDLLTLRERLLNINVILKTSLKEQRGFIDQKYHSLYERLCSKATEGVKADLTDTDAAIAGLIVQDERLKRLADIITSIPCVGPITAIQVIITTNEFRDITCAKKFACYAGVAPFKRQSGLISRKSRISHLANKNVKRLLHLCALGAIRFDDELKSFYVRKTVEEGKPKLSVINAVRNKIIARIFACVKQDRLFEKEYLKPQYNAP